MNSRIENFNRALKTECLDKIIFTNEQQLRFAVKEYLEYWTHYRPHAGLDGRMVLPYPQDADGAIGSVIEERMNLEQFSECDITMSDLTKIRQALVNTLTGVHHHRIKYPKLIYKRNVDGTTKGENV